MYIWCFGIQSLRMGMESVADDWFSCWLSIIAIIGGDSRSKVLWQSSQRQDTESFIRIFLLLLLGNCVYSFFFVVTFRERFLKGFLLIFRTVFLIFSVILVYQQFNIEFLSFHSFSFRGRERSRIFIGGNFIDLVVCEE